ncbi:hypothetical protein A5755_33010 [Mycolicibacterium fortuitum]|nr:hypothetical protein A5754_13470 [Mycolicibacterium fortuitum]OBB52163.1 hypothetical protein A5755_33010 [Mycolicibacterium fortuitum]OBF79438.1 hypothetical protein A5751_19160 [Mycolicibacterium fortuitum]
MAFSGYYPYDEPIDNSPSELSHGRGLRPKHLRGVLPVDGGMYHGKAPSMNPTGRQWHTSRPGQHTKR